VEPWPGLKMKASRWGFNLGGGNADFLRHRAYITLVERSKDE